MSRAIRFNFKKLKGNPARKSLDMTDTPEQERWIKSIPVSMTPPALKDNTADVDRLLKGIAKTVDQEEVRISLPLAKKHSLPSQTTSFSRSRSSLLRFLILAGDRRRSPDRGRFGLRSCRGSRDVYDRGPSRGPCDGEVKEETSFLNPQIQVGPDILTRIHFAGQEGGLRELQALLVTRLNQEIQALAERRGISTRTSSGRPSPAIPR